MTNNPRPADEKQHGAASYKKSKKPPKSPFFHPRHHVIVATKSNRANNNTDEPSTEIVIEAEHKSGVTGCTANLCTCIVGSGIVGLPFAVKEAGLCAGLFLIGLVAIITEKSLRLLIQTAKHVHVGTYELAAAAVFDTAGFRFILVNMFIISFGAQVSYLMILKDSFSSLLLVLPHTGTAAMPSEWQQNLVLLAVSLCIPLPLACLRDMADLDKSSRLAVLIDILLVLLVAWVAPWQQTLEDNSGFWPLLQHDVIHWNTIFVGLGVLSFAFECQESAFLVAGSLRQPTMKRWSYVTALGLTLCAALAVLCGVTGYLGYLDQTRGNILNNLPSSSIAGFVAHGMLGATMFATYPLASFVSRHVCVVLLFQGDAASSDDSTSNGTTPAIDDDTSILDRADRRIALTVALYILAMLPAALFQDFGAVLALAGVIGGSCLAYIGPGILYLGVHGGRFLNLVQECSLLNPRRPATRRANGFGKATAYGTNRDDTDDDKDNNHHRPVTVAVETTPLVSSQQQADELMTKQMSEQERQRQHQRTILGFLQTCLFGALGFPIWCRIAAFGKKNLTGHVHDLVSKSPHPIRIGDVQYSIVKILPDGSVDADPEVHSNVLIHPQYMHQHSAPMQGNAPTTTTLKVEPVALPINIERIQAETTTLEPDPQQEPKWLDFIIAIFYIMFGMIALFAGLFSLFCAKDSR